MKPRLAALAAVVLALGATVPLAAEAKTKVAVGVGLGFNFGYPYYGYRPYWPRYYYPPAYYYPPPAYYYPPPYYYPPAAYPAPATYPAAPSVVMMGSPPESPGWTPGQTYCREWQGQAQIEGQVQQLHGTVCRQPDGSWRFQN